MKFVFFSCILIASILSISSAGKLYCKFVDQYLGYSCEVQNSTAYDGSKIEVDEIIGEHLPNKTNDDVIRVSISNIQGINSIPTGITKFFKNIEDFEYIDQGLTEINSSDLKEFTKVESLGLHYNELERIESGLFQFNPLLRAVYLHENKIKHIDPFVFSKLPNLKGVTVSDNVCKLSKTYGWFSTMKLIEQIENRACFSN
ncbi:hypothetical protein PVAND_006225 [Polypedilum vanderplanki]|uniref:Uncharacterized protein n=1 Tax=Polypedilum vanderplanki TaxID=319348 RepID=A0A9J6C3E5_POLVA|nr:hypothetical protein PVAND_006225 [Polypedilum vanderplanki]